MALPPSRLISIRPLGAALLILLVGGFFTITLILLTTNESIFETGMPWKDNDVNDDDGGGGGAGGVYEGRDDDDFGIHQIKNIFRSPEAHNSIKMNYVKQHKRSSSNFNHDDDNDDAHVDRYFGISIDSRVSNHPDSRPLLCTQLVYKNVIVNNHGNDKQGVSLILVYSDYQFYELKKTLSSLLVSDCIFLIGEIIVVDDASTLDHIKQEAARYFANIPPVKFMTTSGNEPLGLSRARNLAAKEAKFEILVFVDVTVVVGLGWLEPLIDPIVNGNVECFVVPHIDIISDPVGMNHRRLPDNTTYTITWSLNIRPFQFNLPTYDPEKWQPTHIAPAVRGDVFATTRTFFEKIGGYDEELDEYGGGEHVDLSLKAWFCGKGIVLATCSRVAVVNALDPVKVRSKGNRDRLIDLWFSGREVYKTAIQRLSGSSLDASFNYEREEKKEGLIASMFAAKHVRKSGECQKVLMGRYIERVAVNMVELRRDALGYGMLQTGTDRFARIIFVNNAMNNSPNSGIKIKIKLDECQPAIVTDPRVNNINNDININNNINNNIVDEYQPSIFQLTTSSLLVTKINNKDMCLTTKENAYLTFELCRDDNINSNYDDYINKQKFIYNTKDHTLINVWSNYCVMQVTDPDQSTPGDRQIAMVQPCDSYQGHDKGFMKWVFFNL
ncbi:hypothetical protein HELRODRAFT_174433 [Helobdella robusta]|uniref:Glycosyltransferase 2-like domain-containing protein n=1 Tax=Helobdella robusta TaxID=6412 RepID=T1F843_HELRO|nr:hypothetical protein HELRODRAFT_174433 [Helobdella robusta]ESO01486.1 hypothetical protein HELRODRAFT_174433 [Helobdella robusta]